MGFQNLKVNIPLLRNGSSTYKLTGYNGFSNYVSWMLYQKTNMYIYI